MSTAISIENRIEALKSHVHEYRRALNDEGMWLFLATLGCWSVSGKWLQLAALVVTVLLFGRRLQDRLSDRRPFSKMISALRESVEFEFQDGDAKKARLYELIQIERNDLSVSSTLKGGWVFLLCWVFLTVTLAHTLWL